MGVLNRPATVGFAVTWVAALYIFAIPWFVAAAHSRGVWIDEIWSIWLSQHDLPLDQVIAERWLRDVHPPLFSALNWLAAPVVEQNIFERRLLNGVWIALYALSAIWIGRAYPSTAKFFLVFSVLLVGSKFAALYFPEHRSYALSFWSSATALGFYYWAWTLGRDLKPRRDAVASCLLVLASIVALNTHYFSTLILGGALVVLTWALAWRRRWRASALLLMAGVLSGAPLALTLAASAAKLAHAEPGLWLQTTPLQAARLLVTVPAVPIASNLAAVAALALVLARIARRGRGGPALWSDAWLYAAALAGSMLVTSAALLAASLVRPLLIDRYLIAMPVLAAALVAALVSDAVFSRRWLVVALCLNAAVVLTVRSLPRLSEARWSDTAQVVQQHIRTCPDTPVYVVDPAYVHPYVGTRQQPEVHVWGYRLIGREYGFEPRVLRAGGGEPLRLSERCPTLIWGEHLMPREEALAQLRVQKFAQAPEVQAAFRSARVYLGRHGSTGFVVELPPPRATGAGPNVAYSASSSRPSSGPGS